MIGVGLDRRCMNIDRSRMTAKSMRLFVRANLTVVISFVYRSVSRSSCTGRGNAVIFLLPLEQTINVVPLTLPWLQQFSHDSSLVYRGLYQLRYNFTPPSPKIYGRCCWIHFSTFYSRKTIFPRKHGFGIAFAAISRPTILLINVFASDKSFAFFISWKWTSVYWKKKTIINPSLM